MCKVSWNWAKQSEVMLPVLGLIAMVVGLSVTTWGVASAVRLHERAQPTPVIAEPTVLKNLIMPYQHVEIIGDSVASDGSSDPSRTAYPPQTMNDLRQLGLANATTQLELDAITGVQTDAVSHVILSGWFPHTTPDLIIVELGTNDRLHGNLTRDVFTAHYTQLLSILRQLAPRATIVCTSIWGEINLFLNNPNFHMMDYEYNDVISTVCKTVLGSGCTYVDLRPLYLQVSLHMPARKDTIHPNDAGHAAIARALTIAIWDYYVSTHDEGLGSCSERQPRVCGTQF